MERIQLINNSKIVNKVFVTNAVKMCNLRLNIVCTTYIDMSAKGKLKMIEYFVL